MSLMKKIFKPVVKWGGLAMLGAGLLLTPAERNYLLAKAHAAQQYTSNFSHVDCREFRTNAEIINTSNEQNIITLAAEDSDGQEYTTNINLAPHASANPDLENIIPQLEGKTGKLTLTGTQPFSAGQFFTALFENYNGEMSFIRATKSSDASSENYVPHVASDSTWWTGLTITDDKESGETNVIAVLYENGAPIATKDISVNGHYADDAKGIFNDSVPIGSNDLSARLESSGNIVTDIVYGGPLGLGAYLGTTKDGFSTEFYLPLIKSDNEHWTGFALATKGESASGKFVFLNGESGREIGRYDFELAPHSKIAKSVEEMGVALSGVENPWVGIVCDTGEVSALSVLGRTEQGCDIVASEAPKKGKNLVIPLYENHRFNSAAEEVDTEWAVGNPNNETALFDLNFYNSDGNLVSTSSRSLAPGCLYVGNRDDVFFSSDSGHVEISSDKDLVGGWRVYNEAGAGVKLAQTHAGGPAQLIEQAVEEKSGMLESILSGGTIAEARVDFYDETDQNSLGYVTTNSDGTFEIFSNAKRLKISKDGFETWWTNVKEDIPNQDEVYGLISDDFDWGFFDTAYRNNGALSKWDKPAKGIYIDTRTLYTDWNSIPQREIDRALDAAQKIKQYVPAFANAEIQVGDNPPIHEIYLDGYGWVPRPDKGYVRVRWRDAEGMGGTHAEFGADTSRDILLGESIGSSDVAYGTNISPNNKGIHLNEMCQMTGARNDADSYNTIVSKVWSYYNNEFSELDLDAIKFAGSRTSGNTTKIIDGIEYKDYDPPVSD